MMSVLGVFLYFVVSIFGQNEGILIGSSFLYSIVFLIVLFLFIFPVADDFTMDVEIHKKNVKLVVFYQIVGLLTLPILTWYLRTWEEIIIIGLSQLNFLLISSWFIATYLTANESEFGLYKSLKERRNGDDDVDSESSDSDSIVEKTMETVNELNATTCKVCFHKFGETSKRNAPLILISCGHTLCWKCCKELKKQNFNLGVTCPFCRRMTYIDSLRKLPKNYAVIEMIQMKIKEDCSKFE